jgi:iron complex outermembrane receptor protein
MNIFVNANNVFNAAHVDYGNIPQPGRWITAGINFSLQ